MARGRPDLLRVFATAHDAGGASVVVPVATRLAKQQGVHVEFLPRGYCHSYLPTVAPSDHWSWYTMAAPDDFPQVLHYLETRPPDVVLAGTSGNDTFERSLYRFCHKAHLPSVAVLDSWSNYRARFEHPQEPWEHCLPSRIAVMDKWAEREMEDVGFPRERLAVTGHPFWDQLRARVAEHPKVRQSICHELGLEEDGALVLFLADPLRRANERGVIFPYDEHATLAQIVSALEETASGGRRISLLVRSHPTHREGELAWGREPRNLLVLPTDELPIEDLLLASDIIVGIDSTLLCLAYPLGKPVLSMQLGWEQPARQSAAVRLGYAVPIATVPELRQRLGEFIANVLGKGPVAPASRWESIPPDATGRIAKVVRTLAFQRREEESP